MQIRWCYGRSTDRFHFGRLIRTIYVYRCLELRYSLKSTRSSSIRGRSIPYTRRWCTTVQLPTKLSLHETRGEGKKKKKETKDDPTYSPFYLSPLVTSSLVGSWQWWRTLGGSPVTSRIVTAIRFSLALNVFGEGNELARLARTTRPLAGTVEERWHVGYTDWTIREFAFDACVPALRTGFSGTTFRRVVLHFIQIWYLPWITTLVHAFIVVIPTIALLPSLHYLITAESSSRGCDKIKLKTCANRVSKKINNLLHTGETIFLLLILDSVQHVTDIANTAFRKLAVIRPVSARRRRKHDVISVEATWSTLGWKIVLEREYGIYKNI